MKIHLTSASTLDQSLATTDYWRAHFGFLRFCALLILTLTLTLQPADYAAASAGQSFLNSNEQLLPGQYLVSPGGSFKLFLQGDGNLVLYFQNTPKWASNTAGQTVKALLMQADGNLVLYSPTQAIWASNTNGKGTSYLNLQDDGNLVVYQMPASGSATPTWATNTTILRSVLNAGETLQPNQSLVSPNGLLKLLLQSDGNLVLYNQNTPKWASNTAGQSAKSLLMQADGNLVVYTATQAIWASNTNGKGTSFLSLQDDGNLVVYQTPTPDSQIPIWATNTAVVKSVLNLGESLLPGQYLVSPNQGYKLLLQADGNLV